jgi:hypothetical protein
MNKINVSLKVLRSVPLDIVPEEYKDVIEQLLQDMEGKDDALLTIATNDEVFKAFVQRAEKTFFAAKEEAKQDVAAKYLCTCVVAYSCQSCGVEYEDEPVSAIADTPQKAQHELLQTVMTGIIASRLVQCEQGYIKTLTTEEVKENA